LPCYYGLSAGELATVADVGLGLGVLISNLGGGSPPMTFAANPAEPSTEMALKLPNVATTVTTLTTFPPYCLLVFS